MRFVLVVVLALGCTGDDRSDIDRAKQPCVQLRDHLVDLRLASAKGAKDVASHRDAMKRALGDDFVESCQKRMTISQIECATQASDFVAASACSTRTAHQ